MRQVGINLHAMNGLSDEDYIHYIASIGFNALFTGSSLSHDADRLMHIADTCAANNIKFETLHAPFGHINDMWLEGDNGDKIESPQGGGAINVTYNTNVTVDLSENKVQLLYANPNASNQNVAILIMINDLVVAKSDQITPGYGVDSLTLEAYAKERLSVGGYKGELVIRAYDPETGEKAMVDTKGEITITVKE